MDTPVIRERLHTLPLIKRRDEDTFTVVFGYRVNFFQQLGSGGFGTVYKGFDRDESTVAMKLLSKKNGHSTSVEVLSAYYMKKNNIKHSNIVKVLEVKNWRDSMWIVMEFCDEGDLNDYFMNHQESLFPLNWSTFPTYLSIMQDIGEGLIFLHRKDIVHRDIKPGNILAKKEKNRVFSFKIGDFGLSKILDPEDETSSMSSDLGTMAFKAPEFWDRKPGQKISYHRNIDVYSTGLTFAAMLQAEVGQNLKPNAQCQLKPYETNMAIGFIGFSRTADIPVLTSLPWIQKDNSPSRADSRFIDLIRDMTRTSPHKRSSAAETVDRIKEYCYDTKL